MQPLNELVAAPKKARVEIIPLIDVIFFLLATFVLFTLSLNKLEMVDAELPKPVPDTPVDNDTTAFLQVVDGALYWKIGNRGAVEMITMAELRPRLVNYKQSVATPRVMIRSDGKAKFGAAVAALDEVRLAKIKDVSFETIASAAGS
jgi:biopolymer transport protein ExbD